MCETCFPVEKCLVPTSAPYAIVWPLSEMAMLARSQIEILGDTEKILAERVGLWATAVHLSEFQASRRPARAIAGGANMAENCGGTRVNPFPPAGHGLREAPRDGEPPGGRMSVEVIVT